MHNPLFTETLQTLLTDCVICREKNEALFNYLEDGSNRRAISQHLDPLERDVRQTADCNAYVCCYTQIDAPGVKAACKDQFAEAVNVMKPLVDWLCLCMACDPRGTPLKPGDVIEKAELIARIDQSQSHCDTLDRIARNKPFNSTSADPQGQLAQVLNKLTDMGYLINFGHANARFRATGLWSVLYDKMGFIKTYESLEEPDTAAQSRLL